MPVYGTWQQLDDVEHEATAYMMPGYNIEEGPHEQAMGPGYTRPWSPVLNEGMGLFLVDPAGSLEEPGTLGMRGRMQGGVVVFNPLAGPDAYAESVGYEGEAVGDRFAAKDDEAYGGFDMRGPMSISPVDWPPGAVGYEWEDAEGIATVVGARMVLNMTDTVYNSEGVDGEPDTVGLSHTEVQIRADGELGDRLLEVYTIIENDVVHEFEFDLTDDVNDLGEVIVYPRLHKITDWYQVDDNDNTPAPNNVLTAPNDYALDERMFYTLRPPRHRFIYDTANPPRPWRLFPRDGDKLGNNPRLHPAPTTRQAGNRIFPADW